MVKTSQPSVILDKVIFPHQEIIAAIQNYAQFLNKKYQNQNLVIIIVLNGGFLFASYLIHYLKVDLILDFISISTYYQNQKKKDIHFYKELKIDIKNKNVLVLDDIIDTGKTIHLLYDFIKTLQPANVQFTGLILRNNGNSSWETKKFSPVFKIKGLLLLTHNYWIVGFGIDYQEKFRQLKDVYSLKWSNNKKPILTK